MPLPAAVAAHPEKLAHVMGTTGEGVTYRELDARSIRLSRVLERAGIGRGDVVAVLLENNIRYPEVYWGVVRRGCLLTAVNRHLTADEIAYIVSDSGAKAIVTSAAMGPVAKALVDQAPGGALRLVMDGDVDGYERYEDALAAERDDPLPDEPQGDFMNYSSGTTGRPKGVRRASPDLRLDEPSLTEGMFTRLMQLDESTVYLSTAPMYHSAPLAAAMAVQARGGTVVLMERFDAERSLALIEEHRVTHSQWVPTMFVRLLKLEADRREAYDLSPHRLAIHAAAPCPVEVKRQMLEWWGAIVHEYYGGTELNGVTFITADEWLERPGSVGRAIVGTIHVCAEDGTEVPPGEPGLVYFERDARTFQYHGDPEKTRAAEHPAHPSWTTIGDIGFVDGDGYLHLTDRKAFTIISGGVNIYPREIEDALVVHPSVTDVAVFGVPDAEMGERVVAVVQPAPGVTSGDELAEELMAFARERLAGFKVPRTIAYRAALPRLDNGKLYKQVLRAEFLGAN